MQKYKAVNVCHPEDIGVARKLMSDVSRQNTRSHAFRGSIRPIVIIVMIVLTVAVCFLPWPSHIKLTIPGVQFNADKSFHGSGEIVIDAWMYNYLFRPDEFYVNELQVLNQENGMTIKSIHTSLDYSETMDFYHARFASWKLEGNAERINHAAIYFSTDQLNWVIELNGRTFVGSTHENADYAAIMAEFGLNSGS